MKLINSLRFVGGHVLADVASQVPSIGFCP
jgi:hypothetical protein